VDPGALNKIPICLSVYRRVSQTGTCEAQDEATNFDTTEPLE